MKKTFLMTLLSGALFAGINSNGQTTQPRPCTSGETYQTLLLTHPEIAVYQAQLEQEIADKLKNINFNKAARTTDDETGNSGFVYDIPIVIHMIHDFGSEYLTDNEIFTDLIDWNVVYAASNPDTAGVIVPFKQWVGNPHIRIHLATIDPLGNPTKGITRHRSYLTYAGGDQAKFDDWDPTSYVNIWFINSMDASNGWAAAYAYYPSVGAAIPQIDGVIALSSYAANTYGDFCGKTINHELGHVFNLIHPWGGSNQPTATYNSCSDGYSDGVDDTPPTVGHLYGGCTYPIGTNGPTAIYDTVCATNYYKIYTSMDGTLDSLVNYPDTTNAQNIMDYTYCALMFTKGQVARMHAALNSTIAGRNNLWSPTNLTRTGVTTATGAFVPMPDLPPVPAYSVENSNTYVIEYFTCPGMPLHFINKSWNDTITNVEWDFTDGSATSSASITGSTSAPITFSSYKNLSFSQPGWVNISMTATGNGTGGSTTTMFDSSIFIANATGTPASDIVEEFSPGQDLGKWPTFNYYNNEFKWEGCSNAGFYDNYCMKYDGYDNRIIPTMGITPSTGSPYGDFDDFYSIPVDLTSMATGACNLDFWTSGASRSSNSLDINDTLQIYYSYDSTKSWHLLATYGRNDIANMGTIPTYYTPSSLADWVPKTVSIPAGKARGNYVIFKFRYKPGTYMSSPYPSQNGLFSSGNNFYLDRLTFSPYSAEVSSVTTKPMDIVVAPNPTSNNAYVIIKDANNATAKVIVSDITGKVIFTTSQQIIGNDAHIEIPASAIAVKGVYMVQATTGNQTSTQKLVVY